MPKKIPKRRTQRKSQRPQSKRFIKDCFYKAQTADFKLNTQKLIHVNTKRRTNMGYMSKMQTANNSFGSGCYPTQTKLVSLVVLEGTRG